MSIMLSSFKLYVHLERDVPFQFCSCRFAAILHMYFEHWVGLDCYQIGLAAIIFWL